MYKHLYSRFVAENPDELHFAAHSHHYWPDATRDAMIQYWDDAAKMVDRKWDHVFGTIVPDAQRNVAKCLGLSRPEQIVFGATTHEFVCRVLSCFPVGKPIRVLTTDSEFYSFRRQLQRMAEDNVVEPMYVPTDPIDTFTKRMLETLEENQFDLVFLSHAFFNSGFVVDDLDRIVKAVPKATEVMIDAYHSFCALPVSYSNFADRVFVTSGGYKYAQGGEGTCFLSVPKDCKLRPRNTGWFAAFEELEAGQEGIIYGKAGQRFAGATFDPTGTYRFNASMRMLDDQGLSVGDVHAYVQDLQLRFLTRLKDCKHELLTRSRLLYDDFRRTHGHFLTFVLPSARATSAFGKQLRDVGVTIDYRGDRMRFGFGLYQDTSDVDALFDRIASLTG